MANEKFNVVGTNIAEKATVIWNVADMLRGPFKPHEYGLVILPMTVVKRFNDCLLPTHDAVLKEYESKKNFAVLDGFLTKASGYQFYNTSKFTFDSLLADPENIEANFRDYLTKLDMLDIKGIGDSKYLKYGERFLDVICKFKNQGMTSKEDIEEKSAYNSMPESYIQPQISQTKKPIATLKKTQQESSKKIENNSSFKKKREQYTMDGKTYYLMNGKWVNSQFTTVSKEEMYKLNSIRIKNIYFDNIETSELIKIAQEMKDSEDYIFSKKLFDTLFERCSDKEVVRSILSRYTSILRNLEQPEKAIEVAEKYISLYGKYVYTPVLFTSLAGAYCDIGDYVEARKKANVAKAMSGEKCKFRTY